MKPIEKLQLLFTVLEQRAAQHGLPMQVSYRQDNDYVTDYYLNFGIQTFHLWHNVKDISSDWPDGSVGWTEKFGF